MTYTDPQLDHLARYLTFRLTSLDVRQNALAEDHYGVEPKSIGRLMRRVGKPSKALLRLIAGKDGVAVPMLLGDEPLISNEPAVSDTLAFFALALIADRALREDVQKEKGQAIVNVGAGSLSAEWTPKREAKHTSVGVLAFGPKFSDLRYREIVDGAEERISRVEVVDGKPTLVRERRRMRPATSD